MKATILETIKNIPNIHPVAIAINEVIMRDSRWTDDGPRIVQEHAVTRFVISVSERDRDSVASALWAADIDAYMEPGNMTHVFVNVA